MTISALNEGAANEERDGARGRPRARRDPLAAPSPPRAHVSRTSGRRIHVATPRTHRPGRDDRLAQRVLELEVPAQRVPRALAPVAERGPGERQVIAALVDEPP